MPFTEEEMEEWFKSFDLDGSGKIDVKELKQVVKGFYEWQEQAIDDAKIEADVKNMLSTCDSSGDGKIDKKEFFKFFRAP
jgi:serine/threonine-protein phosphatase 2B regulatory subunit